MTSRDEGPPARVRALELFDGSPTVVSRAPGRVNLIGEHTDYNDGFVLPMALPFDTVIVGAPMPSGSGVSLLSEGFGEVTFDPRDPLSARDWSTHLRGIHALLEAEGVEVPDWRGVIATDIPMGASLSSSAAIEIACLGLILALSGEEAWPPDRLARLGQQVENQVLGLPSGIMDQLISAAALAGHASLIDCRTLQTRHFPLPDAHAVVVMDTLTRRELVDSEYAARRADCETAASELGVAALRDASLAELSILAEGRIHNRARHVVTENQRTLDAAAAMTDGDAGRLGELMNASHDSLRDDYEVSGPGLDAIVDAARVAPGCRGARMTGGGFAGCAVALVEVDAVGQFVASVSADYRERTGETPTLWPVQPAHGAAVEVV